MKIHTTNLSHICQCLSIDQIQIYIVAIMPSTHYVDALPQYGPDGWHLVETGWPSIDMEEAGAGVDTTLSTGSPDLEDESVLRFLKDLEIVSAEEEKPVTIVDMSPPDEEEDASMTCLCFNSGGVKY